MPLSSEIISSPFKFLNSYQKDDVETYFGRKNETIKFFELYKDSSLIILHGPSGSGKTSLIYCGLLNRTNLRKNSILSIRRDNHLIDSIKKKLFIITDEQGTIIEDQSKLLDEFLESHSELKRISRGIETIDEMTLQVEDELIKLKRKQQKISVPSGDELQETSNGISKNKQVLDRYVAEREESLIELTEKNQKVIETSHKISTFFKQKNKNTPYVPLIIFDQFEELFVYANPKEMHNFGLFLKLVFDYKIPFNIIISLREEFFGHLDQLQSYIPHIFYKKIRLAHPNRETIKKIIERSFKKFNINQYLDHKEIKERKKLPQEEKDNRIEQIIGQIKIHEGSEVSYHLPFLQVYLDSLYKLDYQRTYPIAVNEEIIAEYGKYPPLEFKEEEIKEFGSIELVLEKYIRAVNHKIINNTHNKLNNRNQHKDSVIKFLRHFRTKNDLKKRIPIQKQKKGLYSIKNEKLLNKIQTDLWGNINTPEYHSTISEIIEELSNKSILNISSDYIELSHDIIAKVIGNIRIEEDFRSLIKKDFNSSFAIYEDTKDAGDLLSTQQIERMNQCLDFILNDDNEERLQRKQEFLRDSIAESSREKREKEKLNLKLRWFFIYPFILTCLLVILAALSKETWKNYVSIKIHEKTENAFREYNIDKTSAFNNIIECDSRLRNGQFLWINNINHLNDYTIGLLDQNTLNLLDDFKNDLYKDYSKTPFYHSSIQLRKKNISTYNFDAIEATKTRKLSNNDSILYIYGFTKSKDLILHSVAYRKKNAKSNWIFEKENILYFEPFESDTGELLTLVAQKNTNSNDSIQLSLLNSKGELVNNNSQYSFKSNSSKIYIDRKAGFSFYIGVDKILMQLDLNIVDGRHKLYILKDDFDDDIEKIKAVNEGENYIVLYGKNKMYYNLFPSKDNFLIGQDLKNDSIYAFKKKGGTIFLGLNRRIRVLDIEKGFEKVNEHFVNDKEINTLAVNDKREMLVGSRDNGANLLDIEDNMVPLKQFIGHKDPIFNVSFVKGDSNYIITSGEDQTIKIWNITPVDSPVSDQDKEYFHKNVNKNTIFKAENINTLDRLDKEKQNSIFRHIKNITDIDYSKDGKYAVSGSSDNSGIIWKKRADSTYDILQMLTSHTSDIVDVAFYENDLILTASSDNTVQIYKKREYENWVTQLLNKPKSEFVQVPSLIQHDCAIYAATFSENGNSIMTVDVVDEYKKWNFNRFDSIIKGRTTYQKKEKGDINLNWLSLTFFKYHMK